MEDNPESIYFNPLLINKLHHSTIKKGVLCMWFSANCDEHQSQYWNMQESKVILFLFLLYPISTTLLSFIAIPFKNLFKIQIFCNNKY